MRKASCSFLLIVTLAWLPTACVSFAETPGERFEKAIKQIAENCAKRKLEPNEACGEVAKLKPADPLATPEGRFAHSIKIPNPVPEDSGYKPGMTPQEYFDHLCKSEAGEFIFKTVENVEGLFMLRPRKEATDSELQHLYALEDPYGHTNWEAKEPAAIFVHPIRYSFLEIPIMLPKPNTNEQFGRFFGYNGRDRKSMQKEFDSARKSRYGYTWRGISRPHDRELGIAGGELIVQDLVTNEVIAVRRGYIRSGGMRNLTGIWWLTGQTCPLYGLRGGRNKDFDFSYWFIGKVLRPANYEQSFKELSHAK